MNAPKPKHQRLVLVVLALVALVGAGLLAAAVTFFAATLALNLSRNAPATDLWT